jgi:hypothetical protein
VPNESTIRSISLYVEVNQVDIYGTMTMSYGILFTLAVLEYFISTEEYERCKTIVEGISRLNSLYKCDLPHSLTDKWCMENMELSPLQILEKHYHNQTNK